MKQFEVIIDRSSTHLVVDANTKEEAEVKALKEFKENDKWNSFEYWVGDSEEVN